MLNLDNLPRFASFADKERATRGLTDAAQYAALCVEDSDAWKEKAYRFVRVANLLYPHLRRDQITAVLRVSGGSLLPTDTKALLSVKGIGPATIRAIDSTPGDLAKLFRLTHQANQALTYARGFSDALGAWADRKGLA